MDGLGYGDEEELLYIILGKIVYIGIDYYWKEVVFVICG